jgi:hypothetical protein
VGRVVRPRDARATAPAILGSHEDDRMTENAGEAATGLATPTGRGRNYASNSRSTSAHCRDC